MENGKIYEVDVGYNLKLLEWLKGCHVQISSDQTGITIKVPFSSPQDLQYAKKFATKLDSPINPLFFLIV